jgi:Spx/MgsR family transcriptional regulator
MPVKQTDLLQVYGLKNCDTCSKAQAWLKEHAVHYRFRDVRSDGLEKSQLKRWLASPLADLLINRRSTTWRSLTPEEKALSESNPSRLLLTHPALMKRPVLERHGKLLMIGFSADEFREHLLS